MAFFDERDGMLLGLAHRQRNMENAYEDQIAYLVDLVHRHQAALEAERQRNDQLREALDGLGSNDPIRKILAKALGDAKTERDRLEAQIAELRTMVEQRDRKISSTAISYLVQSSAVAGLIAQVKAVQDHHPDSPLLAAGEVPGHPDLPHRSPLHTVFDRAYSASLKSMGITAQHLEQISTPTWKPRHPEYLDRDPGPEMPVAEVTTPKI